MPVLRRQAPVLLATTCMAWTLTASHASEIPPTVDDLLATYCLDCHDQASAKGDIILERDAIDWSRGQERALWEKVLKVTRDERMPPARRDQPTKDERQALATWLDASLLEHTPIGGTPPRRLNQSEYEATIRDLLNLPDFELPTGFPRDSELHGFTNLGEGLVLSPPLLEAYRNIAVQVADRIFPAPKPAPESVVRTASPQDLVISFSASSVREGALRLASRSTTTMRSCTWPSRIEITDSGTYRITVDTSTFRPTSKEPMQLELRARSTTASDRTHIKHFRLLETLAVTTETPTSRTFTADLYEGETILFRWANAEMTHDTPELARHMKEWFARDQRWLAAWQETVFPDGATRPRNTTPLRGGNGWNILKRHLADPELDLSRATMDSKTTRQLLEIFDSNQGTFNLADALCFHYFENGPSLEIHGVKVEGPLARVEGPKDRQRQALQEALFGTRRPGQSDEHFAREALQRFLPLAFRRPVDDETLGSFLTIATDHWAQGHSFEKGMHLVLRSVLISPRFLYRCLSPGPLDDFDLATRLSYFLTGGPPDATLVDLTQRGRLSEDWVLKREAERLLPKRPSDPMVRRFTGQWLDTDLLGGIMPDPAFRFTPYYVDMAREEVESFFAAMLRENRPLADFIDPDFTYTSPLFAREVYGMTLESQRRESGAEQRQLRRISLPRGSRHGGLLGMSGIMMATANGVDTQPVLRGVWVLENILGSPPPPPPANVPALTPDTRGATTPRELLAAHTDDPNCATCHQQIDPLGFVLENFDPVGRWRERWPKSDRPIDPSGTLPDGTPIADINALKRWLVADIDRFSICLAEKLLTYATGRVSNHAERHEIEALVERNRIDGNGFRDLVLELIASRTFRTR